MPREVPIKKISEPIPLLKLLIHCGLIQSASDGRRIIAEGGEARVELIEQTREGSAFHGLTRSLLANMVHGVHEGYEKQLELIGVGYKAQVQGKKITLHLGFSRPIEFPIPEGIEVFQDEKNKNILILRGIDKQLIGQTASAIRAFRPPEPYKGKGIRYVGEHVRRKVGKTAAAKSS